MEEDPTDVSLEHIDADIRAEIGDPVRLPFAATVVYLPLFLISLAIGIFVADTIPGPVTSATGVSTEFALGGGVGLLVVALTQILTRHVRSFQLLEVELAKVLGPLTSREILQFVVLSGLAEEALFRGCIQPALGYWATSILFGLVHFVPGSRVLLPWTLFALGGGFLFGGLFAWRESLIAPAVAHVVINGLNIYMIVQRARAARRERNLAAAAT